MNIVGKTVKVTDNKARHNIPIGTLCEVINHYQDNNDVVVRNPAGTGNRTLYVADYILVPLSADTIREEVAKLQKQIDSHNESLQIMEETGLEEYDPELFRIMRAIKIMEKGGSLKESAVKIKEILKNG